MPYEISLHSYFSIILTTKHKATKLQFEQIILQYQTKPNQYP